MCAEIGVGEPLGLCPPNYGRSSVFSRCRRRVGAEIPFDRPTITCVDTAPASTPGIVYDGAVEPADLGEWERELDGVVARIAPLFYRTESKRHGEQYLRGLLSPLARKNGWTIAEYVGEPEPKALQRLLNLSPWDVDALLAISIGSTRWRIWPTRAAILVADPTGFREKGQEVGRGAAAVLGNAGADRQLSDRDASWRTSPRAGTGC